MSVVAAAETGPDTPPLEGQKRRTRKRQVAKAFFRLSRGFWTGSSRGKAWVLTGSLLVFALAVLGVSIGVNQWNAYFFNALERKDAASVFNGVWMILGLALIGILMQVGLVLSRMRLSVRWRQWITAQLVDRWLSDRRFYQLTIVGNDASNPEFRIADDTRLAVEPLVDFSVGILNAILNAVAFLGILFVVGGSITVYGVTIPAYMSIAVVAYAAITSTAMYFIGRPLVGRTADKNAGEAQFRYELTRVKDSSESIALIGGDDDEKRRLGETFEQLANRWLAVIRQQARMTWVSQANFMLASVIPLLLGAPKYLSGELTLGGLMQLQSAFIAVQWALNWLVDNSIRIAEWYASAMRVIELTDALDELDETIGKHGASDTIVLGFSPDDAIHLRNLSIAQQAGEIVIGSAELTIRKGEKVLVRGESGTGKSTLIRAMAGLWPWGSGEILRPKGARMGFMPQKPYIPLGTLRWALLYPDGDRKIAEDRILDALKRCGLSHLAPRLDEEENWEGILSGGEKQRLAFARLLLAPPDFVIMDEATSALDELSQTRMLEFLRTDLAACTVISVGHRQGLEEFHDREINLVRTASGPARTEPIRRRPRLMTLLGFGR